MGISVTEDATNTAGCLRRLGLGLGLALLLLPWTAAAQNWTVGMSGGGTPIEAYGVPAKVGDAATVLVLGGLSGDLASSGVVQAGYDSYVNTADNFLNVHFLPDANPDNETLVFPPSGQAYRDNPTAYSLWRWIGTHAPDRVIIMGQDEYGLAEALEQGVMEAGRIPVDFLDFESQLIESITGQRVYPRSAASASLGRRLERTPAQFAAGLAEHYGHDFSSLTYIPGMALIGRMRLGQTDQVRELARPWLEDADGIEIRSSLNIAGHLVFAELAERGGDADFLALAQGAAELGFDSAGQPLEAMPLHSEMSDAFFMATPLLAKVGKLTGERRYFDLAARHVRYLDELLRRPDGLYTHSPLADAAWGRGNAFVALGLALALSDFPQDHPGRETLLGIYREHMRVLLDYLDVDGLWHNVIDLPGSYPELSATAMIATAMLRGVEQGWLENFYRGVVDQAWQAARLRTRLDYGFVNVCESTNKQDSLQAYIDREALLGRDDRAGGMLLMFATELMAASSAEE